MENRQTGDEDPPTTPAEAVEDLGLKITELITVVNDGHELLWDEQSTRSRRIEFAFRVPSDREVEPYHDHNLNGDWVRYSCDLTGIGAAARLGAPVPQILLYEDSLSGESLLKTYLLHPDFLRDRGFLIKMVAAKMEEEIEGAFYDAMRALRVLQSLSDKERLDGLPSEGVSYPQGRGYLALGKRRPVEELDE
jgi:hypothetical protein